MDEIIRAVTGDGYAKISAISAKGMIERARQLHDTSPVATAALGRSLCAASMLGDLLKEETATLTLRINGGGPIGTVIAVSDSQGMVRGYVENPQVDVPNREDGKLNVGAAVGVDGMLTISRDLGLKEPYIGSTRLVSGEIAEDLAYYYMESEQVASAVGLGVLVDTDLSVKCAGGFIVQLLPGAPDSLIDMIEENIQITGQVTGILENGCAQDLVDAVFMDLSPETLSSTSVEYRCYCSRERVRRAVESLSLEDLREIYAGGEAAQVSCQFCNTVYDFSGDEILEMINAHEAVDN